MRETFPYGCKHLFIPQANDNHYFRVDHKRFITPNGSHFFYSNLVKVLQDRLLVAYLVVLKGFLLAMISRGPLSKTLFRNYYIMKNLNKLSMVILIALFINVSRLMAATFTLSDDALMSLDWDMTDKYPDRDAIVFNKIDVGGAGIYVDIWYPSNDTSANSLIWLTSSQWAGDGTLAGIDVDGYDDFALNFELININGVTDPLEEHAMIVGAVVNHSNIAYSAAFQPKGIAIGGGMSASATSETTTAGSVDIIRNIGLVAYIPYMNNNADAWNPNGQNVRIKVSQAIGADIIDVPQVPEPATMGLLGLGAVSVMRRKLKR